MNLKEQFNQIKDYFSPKIIGEVNDVFVKLVKIKGNDIPWHAHKNEDELFYIIEGSLQFEIKGQPSFTMNEGDLFIVKKNVEHRVSSVEECKIMLIENKTTLHTGDVQSLITKTIECQKKMR
ncbi:MULTISPECIES: cupin domain-containing protein [unclassified Allomuricauda]|uniref:cupin domain-containing protein n=1 Tax=unclassified Allomuricauda TaxID=2615049 RepID=UPI00273D27ED|nr:MULTISPECIES: cupin domain-containing protein [unclassified Allomuricauda]